VYATPKLNKCTENIFRRPEKMPNEEKEKIYD
jgi:hypothetical protein